MASSWPAPRKAMSGLRSRSSMQPLPSSCAGVPALPRIDSASGIVTALREEAVLPPLEPARRSTSAASSSRRTGSVRLTPSMAQIADRDLVVELRGFPTPAQFRVGGKQGNAVTKSSTNQVHRGWRVAAIDGRRVSPQEAAAALAEAQQRNRYSVTFRIGESDDRPEDKRELEARLKAEAEEALQLRLAAQREAQLQAEREAEWRRQLEEQEAERIRREAEEAERLLKEAEEEAERKRREREEEERLSREREEAELERKRREAAEAAERKRRQREEEEARRRQEAEEAERKRLEAERKQKEAEEEADRRRREEEAERRRQEEEAERQRLEAEEQERRQREAEELLRKRREEAAAELRRAAALEEAAAIKRQEALEAERARREAEEAESRRREAEEAERRRREAEEAQRKRREAEEAERKRREAEDAERARKEAEAAERRRREAEEAERKRKEAEKAERRRKEAAEAESKRRREAEEAERRRQEAEEAERRRKQAEEEAAAERRMQEQLAAARRAAQQNLQRSTGLPPREKVVEPQKALMAALTSPKPTAAPKPTGPCDKCDGPHDTDACPHFKKARDKHADEQKAIDAKSSDETKAFTAELKEKGFGKPAVAWANYGSSGKESKGGGQHVLRSAKVVPQPGDGSCLFHSLSYGLGIKHQASKLRAEIADYIASSPEAEVAGNPLKDWILWDSGLDAASYARTMRTGSRWGGALELAVCARLKRVRVHVYERGKGGGFVRISDFEGDAGPGAGTVSVLYGGRVHYDALEV